MSSSNNLLIDVISNTVAGIKAFNQCIALDDVQNDGNARLICADMNNRLKIFKDDILQFDTKIPVAPVGIVAFHAYDSNKTLVPLLAVAGNNFIYIYKNLKGTVRLPIPNQDINSAEKALYDHFLDNTIEVDTLLSELIALNNKVRNYASKQNDDDNDDECIQNDLKPLSHFTIEALNQKTKQKQIDFLNKNKDVKIVVVNYITCINAIPITASLSKKATPSNLLIGTEMSMLMIVDPSVNKIVSKVTLPEVPYIISSIGGFSENHTIFVADRGNGVHLINRNKVVSKSILVSQVIISMLISNSQIYIGTTSQNYECYTQDGSKQFSLKQPNAIITMEIYQRVKEGNLSLCVIAVKNNTIRLYKDKSLIYVYELSDNVYGMKTGSFGTRDDCLVLLTYKGQLFIKQFNPEVNFASVKANDEIHNVKGSINIPKKTPMYLEMIQREKETCADMQTSFQNDLLRMRYKAMDTYVKMLKIGNAPQNYSSSSTMKLSALLQGLGPDFKLNLIIDNVGNEPLYNTELTLDYNRNVYSFSKENIQLGLIMPHIPVKYSLSFKNISEMGSAGMIKVVIIDKLKSAPLIQSTIKVPVSELEIL